MWIEIIHFHDVAKRGQWSLLGANIYTQNLLRTCYSGTKFNYACLYSQKEINDQVTTWECGTARTPMLSFTNSGDVKRTFNLCAIIQTFSFQNFQLNLVSKSAKIKQRNLWRGKISSGLSSVLHAATSKVSKVKTRLLTHQWRQRIKENGDQEKTEIVHSTQILSGIMRRQRHHNIWK